MSLQDDIADFIQQAASRIPEDIRLVMKSATETLAASGVAELGPKVGDKAPGFSLPNARGQTVDIADKLKDGPVVVSFYRGGWCPYCNLELRALQQKLPEIEDLGASLVAVSPETPDHSLSTAEKNELNFEVLSDVGNSVARDFNLLFEVAEELRPIYDKFGIDIPGYNGDDTYELPMPATYVIDTDGTVLHAFVDADYTKRMEPDDIVAALKRRKG